MKKLFIAVMALVATACTTKNPSGDITINVDVENPTAKKVEIALDRGATWTIDLDEQGRGQLVLPKMESMYPKVIYGEESKKIFVAKGEEVTLRFDARKFKDEPIEVDGDNEEANDYLQKVTLPKPPDFALNWEPFTADLKSKLDDVLKMMADMKLDRKCPDFYNIECARMDYMFQHTLFMYPLGHAWKAGEFTYDKRYYAEIERLLVEHEDFIMMDAYRSYIEQAIPVLLEQKSNFKSNYEKKIATMNYIMEHFESDRIKQTMLTTIALNYILTVGDQGTDEMQAMVRKHVQDPQLLTLFNTKLEHLDPISTGFLSPDFEAVNVKGETKSLKDFAGKYVYIDVWATWCNPCREQQAELKKLEKLFEGRRIAFVSLSIDKDKAAWEKMVRDEKLVGNQLWMGDNTSFKEVYGINSIPRFILLDKNGRIIDANMTKPSDEKTALTLRKLKMI